MLKASFPISSFPRSTAAIVVHSPPSSHRAILHDGSARRRRQDGQVQLTSNRVSFSAVHREEPADSGLDAGCGRAQTVAARMRHRVKFPSCLGFEIRLATEGAPFAGIRQTRERGESMTIIIEMEPPVKPGFKSRSFHRQPRRCSSMADSPPVWQTRPSEKHAGSLSSRVRGRTPPGLR